MVRPGFWTPVTFTTYRRRRREEGRGRRRQDEEGGGIAWGWTFHLIW